MNIYLDVDPQVQKTSTNIRKLLFRTVEKLLFRTLFHVNNNDTEEFCILYYNGIKF